MMLPSVLGVSGLVWLQTVSLALCFALPTAAAAPKTQARLILSAQSVRPGEKVLAGIELRMPKGWHTYWRHSGDSGQPTQIRWILPPEVSAGPILWPVPEKEVSPPLTTYVYSSNVVLLVPLQIGRSAHPGPVSLQAKVSWLECGQICLPGQAEVKAALTIGPETKPSSEAALLAAWTNSIPSPVAGTALFSATWEPGPGSDTRSLAIRAQPGLGSEATELLEFFPYFSDAYEVAGETVVLPAGAGPNALRKEVRRLGTTWPGRVEGVLVFKGRQPGPLQASEVILQPTGP